VPDSLPVPVRASCVLPPLPLLWGNLAIARTYAHALPHHAFHSAEAVTYSGTPKTYVSKFTTVLNTAWKVRTHMHVNMQAGPEAFQSSIM